MPGTRRLAAILAADVAGYSRLIGADEGGTLQAFKTIQAEVFDSAIAERDGRLVKTTGDGFLVEFGSVVDAALRGRGAGPYGRAQHDGGDGLRIEMQLLNSSIPPALPQHACRRPQ
jgi:class 3 adenylate cyclase